MKLLLKDIRLLNPEQKLDEINNVLIENGIITKIGNIQGSDADKVLELKGKIAVPGFYDMHVHLREPGREDEETILSGSNAAAAGGFTGIACMPNTNPTIDSAEVVTSIIGKSKNHLVDVNPIGAVTIGRKGETLAPFAELTDAGAVAFSDDGTAVKTAEIVRHALEYLSMHNALLIEHCEDESLSGGSMNESEISTLLGLPPIPSVAEDLIIMRDIQIAEYTKGRIHIAHISTKNGVQLVRNAKARGLNVTAEATPHHFSLTDDSLKMYDTNFKMSPPLRQQEDVEAIIEGLKDGTIDCIASDHAPHSIEEKEMEFIYAPNGIIGLETQLGLSISELVNKGYLTLEQLVEKLSINPRKILNLPIPKFEIGKKANMTVMDTEIIWTVDVKRFKSKSKNSPFNNRLLTGKSVAVINNGQLFFEDEFSRI